MSLCAVDTTESLRVVLWTESYSCVSNLWHLSLKIASSFQTAVLFSWQRSLAVALFSSPCLSVGLFNVLLESEK